MRVGLVANLNRPGGNVTGVVFTSSDLTAKQLGLLHELVPKSTVIAALFDPGAPSAEFQMRDAEEAGRTLGRQVLIVKAADERDFAAAFGTIVQAGGGGLLVGGSAFFLSRRRQLATLAARHALPAISILRSFTEAGLLMSYGASQTDAYRRAGHYAGRILKGAKPADMPVELANRSRHQLRNCEGARRRNPRQVARARRRGHRMTRRDFITLPVGTSQRGKVGAGARLGPKGAARPRKPRHALPKRGGVFSVSTFLRQAWAQGRRRGAMVHWPDAHAGRGVMPGAQGAERDGAEHRASAPPWAVLQCCESPWRRRLGWG